MDFSTQRGVFGPGGHGGGVFQTTVMGLGGVNIPASCWDQPGFKSCHTEAGHKAHRLCKDAGKDPERDREDWNKCYGLVLEDGIRFCMDKYCGTTSYTSSISRDLTERMGLLPYRKYSEDTVTVQRKANTLLPTIGRKTIQVDGKLGPQTCSAIQALASADRHEGWVVPDSCSQVSSSALPTTTQDPLTYSAPEKDNTALYVIGGAAILLGGGFLVWKAMK